MVLVIHTWSLVVLLFDVCLIDLHRETSPNESRPALAGMSHIGKSMDNSTVALEKSLGRSSADANHASATLLVCLTLGRGLNCRLWVASDAVLLQFSWPQKGSQLEKALYLSKHKTHH